MSIALQNDPPSPTLPCSPERARERFIDRMGDHLEAEGLPRIAGRLFGLMMLEPGPVSFGDLASRLGVSRGSISTNARLIEAQGLIERVAVAGERQDFFRLARDPYVKMLQGVIARMRETQATVAEARAALAGSPSAEDLRLEEAERFIGAAVASLTDLTGMLSSPRDAGGRP